MERSEQGPRRLAGGREVTENGKGDKPRPSQVPAEQIRKNHDRIYKRWKEIKRDATETVKKE